MQYEFEDDPKLREEAWTHARDVLTIPEFLPLSYLVRHCYIVERILMNYEDSQKVDDHGVTQMVNDEEIVALADYWILGFFDILRIITNGRYLKYAEFPARKLQGLRKKTAFVRSAFAKLQLTGSRKSIVPSYSSIGSKRGVVYAVYNGEGEEVDISRRELADEFLCQLKKHKPSQRMKECHARITS